MIVAQQVKDAVDQEPYHLVEQHVPPFCRLPPSGRQRNDDIAKKKRGQIYFSRRKINLSPFPFVIHRKSQDVRRTVFTAVTGVQCAHAPVRDQQHTQFGVTGSRRGEDGHGSPAQPREIDPYRALTVLENDGHRVIRTDGKSSNGPASRYVAGRP